MTPRGTALAMHHETWPEYIRRVTSGVSRKDIACAAEVNVSGVSRWMTGASRPSAEKVVSFARGLHLNPVEALVAAGYLDAAEIDGAVEVVRARSQLSDDELLRELAQRLRRSSRIVTDESQDSSWPPIHWEAPGKESRVVRDEDGEHRDQGRGR